MSRPDKTLREIKDCFRRGELGKAEYIDAMFGKHCGLFDYVSVLQTTDVEKIEVTSEGVEWTTRPFGLRWATAAPDKRSAPFEILNFDRYEPEYFAMMTRLMDPGMTVMDIGANIGWFSLNFSRAVERLAIWSFEPIPATFENLKKNLQLNQAGNIQAWNIGLSDRSGSVPFFVDPDLSTSASEVNITELTHPHTAVCELRTMDAFCEEQSIRPDFIKCDVEGAELLVFRGGRQTIRESRPILCTEMLRKWSAKYNYHPNDIVSFLGNLGYQCFVEEHGRLKALDKVTEETKDTNFFFLHRDLHKEKIRQWEVA